MRGPFTREALCPACSGEGHTSFQNHVGLYVSVECWLCKGHGTVSKATLFRDWFDTWHEVKEYVKYNYLS